MGTTMQTTAFPISTAYDAPIWRSVMHQVLFGLLTLLILDGGHSSKVCGVAILGYWMGTLLVVLQRPHSPLESDIRYVRNAFFPLLVVTYLLDAWMH
jgi:hypothetical protein